MTGLYIASNPTALSAQFQMQRNMGDLGETLTRLSTGLKINSGKDDPAGLIASELLKAQLTGTSRAVTNTQRANALVATADGALGQISNLLNDIKGLTVEAANTGVMTADQIAANQLQVDAALDSIDRIARTTNYGGKKLLDGSLGFRTAGMTGGIDNVQINSANFGNAPTIGVGVNVQQVAEYARLVSNGTGVSVDTTFDVIGNRGSATVSMGAGCTNDQIAAAINKFTDSTGVVAYVEGKAERGSIVLSSAGASNDILITAQQQGFDAGNYAFRITRSSTGENDIRIVQEASGGNPGIVEIALVEGQEQQYNSFAGLFNITIDTTGRASDAETAVSMTRGNANSVQYSAVERAAATNVVNGKNIVATKVEGTSQSALNGWTIAVNNDVAKTKGAEVADIDTKTVYINTSSDRDDVNIILSNALAKTNLGEQVGDNPIVHVDAVGFAFGNPGDLQNGARYTFSGGSNAGEVAITYSEGATANDILKMLNSAPSVNASLAAGVDGNALIKNLPDGATNVSSNTSVISTYTSGATAQDVIELINSKLGDKFVATNLEADGSSGGRVTYMDAYADYGDINLGNALRFTGMDNGPIIRMTNLGSNGQQIANQKLSVNILHPSDADIKSGINTPVLEIRLATDAQGNSITSAKDIADYFKSLTATQTMGVSVAQVYPPGVDPNGRVFGVDATGKAFVEETCPTPIDGLVQPTGAPGPCGPQQGDLVLLGTNQRIVADNAVARVAGNNRPTKNEATEVTSSESANPNSNRIALAGTGTTSSAVTLSDRFVNALGGMTLAFDTNVDPDTAPPASFVDGVLTLAMGGTPSATLDASGIADALNAVLDLRSYDQYSGLLTEINNWRTSNGLAAIDSSFRVAEEDITLSLTDKDGDPITAGSEVLAGTDSFLIQKNASVGPTLTFSMEDAQKLDGITFKFQANGGTADTASFDAATKTITIGFGEDTGTLDNILALTVDNAAFASRVGEAMSLMTDAGHADFAAFTELGFAEDQQIVLERAHGKENLQLEPATVVPGTVPAVAARGTTGQLTVGTNPPISFTISTGDQGENTAALNGMKIVFTTDGAASTYDAGSNTLSVFLAAAALDATTDAASLETALNTALRDSATVTAINGALGLVTPATVIGANLSVTVSGTGSTAGWGAGDVSSAMMTSVSAATLSGGVNERELTATEMARGSQTTITAPLLVDTTKAVTDSALSGDSAGKTILTFDNTSAMNGVTFGFTRDEKREGFDTATGTLMVYLGSEFNGDDAPDEMLRKAVNDAISANWEAIRSFTGATGNAVRLAEVQQKVDTSVTTETDPLYKRGFSVASALHDAALSDAAGAVAGAGTTRISSSFLEGKDITGTRGVATDDPAMMITALEKGTQMAGVSVHFVNDTNSGLKEYNSAYKADYGANDELPELRVDIVDKEDGSRELIITANLGTGAMSELNAGLLAKALNANAKFSSTFRADAMQFGAGTAVGAGIAGSILFNRDVTKPSATTVGGYKIESSPTGSTNTATSSGVGMFGQSDSNERLVIESEELGSEQFVQVSVVKGYMNTVDETGYSSGYAKGHDMQATVNGIKATTKGNTVAINTTDLSASMNVANVTGSYGFDITGGGALFQLGPDVVSQQQIRVGIASMLTSNLGGASGRLSQLRDGNEAALTSDDNGRKLADRIVNEAISNVANIRGRLGALQRGTLEPNILSLQDSLTAITENSAMITNADFAVESSNLMRLQLLVQAGAQTLGIANQLPQYAASLVR